MVWNSAKDADTFQGSGVGVVQQAMPQMPEVYCQECTTKHAVIRSVCLHLLQVTCAIACMAHNRITVPDTSDSASAKRYPLWQTRTSI